MNYKCCLLVFVVIIMIIEEKSSHLLVVFDHPKTSDLYKSISKMLSQVKGQHSVSECVQATHPNIAVMAENTLGLP